MKGYRILELAYEGKNLICDNPCNLWTEKIPVEKGKKMGQGWVGLPVEEFVQTGFQPLLCYEDKCSVGMMCCFVVPAVTARQNQGYRFLHVSG